MEEKMIEALRECLEHVIVSWKLGDSVTSKDVAWYQSVMNNSSLEARSK